MGNEARDSQNRKNFTQGQLNRFMKERGLYDEWQSLGMTNAAAVCCFAASRKVVCLRTGIMFGVFWLLSSMSDDTHGETNRTVERKAQ